MRQHTFGWAWSLLLGTVLLLSDCGGRALSGGGGAGSDSTGTGATAGIGTGATGIGVTGIGGTIGTGPGPGGATAQGFGGDGMAGGAPGGMAGISGAGQGGMPTDWNSVPQGCVLGVEQGAAGEGGSPNDDDCRCTRRMGPGTSMQCPTGVGMSAGYTIGPDGGTIEYSGSPSTHVPLRLVIPPGALAAETVIIVTETTIEPPDDISDWSPLYRFEPAGLELMLPAELRIPWSNLDGLVSDLEIYWSAEAGSCALEALPNGNTNAGFSTAPIRHLGWGLVGTVKPTGSDCP